MAAPLSSLVNRELGVRLDARPQRVAFVFDADSTPVSELSSFIAASSRTWGGRFHCLIPSRKSQILGSWKELLRLADPDVVMLDEGFELEELDDGGIAPSRLIRTARSADRRFHRSSYDGLAVEPIPQYFTGRHKGWDSPKFLNLHDDWAAGPLDMFMRVNLGTMEGTFSSDNSLKGLAATTFALGKGDAAKAAQFLMEEKGWVISTMDLAQSYQLPSLRFENDPRAFTLVVGSSTMDIAHGWNVGAIKAASVSGYGPFEPAIGKRGLSTLWVPQELVEDAAAIDLIARLIDQRCWFPNDGGVRLNAESFTIPVAGMAGLCDAIKGKLPTWRTIWPGTMTTLTPETVAIPKTQGRLRFGERFDRAHDFARNSVAVDMPSFRFFDDYEYSPGKSALDVSIELPSERFVQGPRERWELPQRIELTTLFLPSGYENGRILADGRPSLLVEPGGPPLSLAIPETIDLFWRLLCAHARFGKYPHAEVRPGRLRDIAVSPEGKRLRGLIGLFGGVAETAQLFDDEFWRSILFEMAGGHSGNSPQDRVTTLLTERLTAGTFPKIPANVPDLATALIREASRQGPAGKMLTWDDFKGRMNKFHGEAKLRDGDVRGELNEFVAQESDRLRSLIEAKLFLQGMRFDCPHCGQTRWRAIADVAATMLCDACQSSFSLPMEDQVWVFRLNELAARAINDKGVMNVLRAMGHLDFIAHRTVVFCPTINVFVEGQATPLTDLDIVAVYEGKLLIGEVKSCAQSFKPADLDHLEQIARIVRPNEILLAAPDEPAFGWGPTLDMAKQLAERLKALDVSVMIMKLNWTNQSALERVPAS